MFRNFEHAGFLNIYAILIKTFNKVTKFWQWRLKKILLFCWAVGKNWIRIILMNMYKEHSFVKHLFFGWVFLWIPTLIFLFSKDHIFYVRKWVLETLEHLIIFNHLMRCSNYICLYFKNYCENLFVETECVVSVKFDISYVSHSID